MSLTIRPAGYKALTRGRQRYRLPYLKPPGQRWNWLRVDRLLGEWEFPKTAPLDASGLAG